MVSPFDLVRLKEEEEARLLAQLKLEEERNKNRLRRGASRSAPSPETQIELQGIISSPDGANKAIVNNEVVGPGEMVGKVRVVRITDVGVTFEYKGKKFSRSVNKD